jgi:hypothetical protein
MSEAQLEVPESDAAEGSRGGRARSVVVGLVNFGMWAFIYYIVPAKFKTALLVGIGGIILAFIVFMAVFIVRSLRQGRRFVAELNQALAAIGRGHLLQARDTFWKWAETSKSPITASCARHNLAWTLMRQGELKHASAVWTDLMNRYPGALTTTGLSATSAVDLALCHGLLGDLDAAEKWMTEAEQRTQPQSGAGLPAMKTYARAVLDCRAGRCADAARVLDDGWAECEAQLTGDVVRPLRVIRAFALAAAGPRDAGIAETIVIAARPAYTGEYDFLGAAWAEMASFLVAHQLTRLMPDELGHLARAPGPEEIVSLATK